MDTKLVEPSGDNSHLPTKAPSENPTVTSRLRKSSSIGLFKLFSKGIPNDAKQELRDLCKANGEQSVTAGLRDIGLEVAPCNFIRPTGLKLEPRRERCSTGYSPTSCRRPSLRISPVYSDFNPVIKLNDVEIPRTSQAKATFQSRASNARIFIKDINDKPKLSTCDSSLRSPLLSPVSPVHETGLPAFASLELQFVVGRIAMDKESTRQWTSWLNSYARGHFSVQNPPDHPPLSPTFTHLPAVYSKNEENRSTICKDYRHIWQRMSQERAEAHMKDILKKFEVRYGAISYFDNEYEVFKAEKGYNVSRVQRSSSLAAHALYTTEVISVLDTQKDWRFQDNPMVTGKPRIRFFAATPLVSPTGGFIGVLSIFSRDSRNLFTYEDSRRFAKYGASLTADLNAHHESSQSMLRVLTQSQQNTFPRLSTTVKKLSSPRQCPPSKNECKLQDTNSIGGSCSQEYLSNPESQQLKFGSLMQPMDQIITNPKNNRSLVTICSTSKPTTNIEQGCGHIEENSPKSQDQVRFESTSSVSRPRADSITLSHRTSASELTSKSTLRLQTNHDVSFESASQGGSKKSESLNKSSPIYSPLSPPPPIPEMINSGLREKITPSFDEDLSMYEYDPSLVMQPFTSTDKSSPKSLQPLALTREPVDNDLSLHLSRDMTVEDFLSLSDGDLIEDPEDNLSVEINLNTNYRSDPIMVRESNTLSKKQYNNHCVPRDQVDPQHNHLTTNVSRSFTSRLQSKKRMSENFFMWKFPKFESELSCTDILRLDDANIRSNDLYLCSNPSLPDTPTSILTLASDTLSKDYE